MGNLDGYRRKIMLGVERKMKSNVVNFVHFEIQVTWRHYVTIIGVWKIGSRLDVKV